MESSLQVSNVLDRLCYQFNDSSRNTFLTVSKQEEKSRTRNERYISLMCSFSTIPTANLIIIL